MFKYLKDIRFWIILLFLVRLVNVTNPPLEVSHNWRQTTVTMVARNFLEVDNNIFYPRIDIAGDKTGITGMEFPLFNYLIYLTSTVFGYSHWYGRLINLIVSSFGIWYFFLLIRKFFKEKTAFYASFILLASIWFSFSRKIMPDTFSMSLIIASIYYGTNYFEDKSLKSNIVNIFLYMILLILGSLSKIPSVYLLVVFALFIFNKKIILKNKIVFILASVISILPAYWWYYKWVPYLVNEYRFWHFFMGKDFSIAFKEILNNIPLTLKRFYDTALKYFGFTLFIYGFYQAVKLKNSKLLLIFTLGFLSFLLIIFKSGFTFFHHNYYIIPFVPVMALVAGYGLSKIKNQTVVILFMTAVFFEGTLNQHNDFVIHKKNYELLNLENDLDKFSSKNDLILINSGDFPTPMYFAHRKGWVLSNDRISKSKKIKDLQSKKLKYIVILKKTFGSEIKLDFTIVFENDNYTIYKL